VVKTQPDYGVERSVGPGCGLPSSRDWHPAGRAVAEVTSK
jgi:hypothetical protein